MAEFLEVMRQGKRMCERRDACVSCPIFNAKIGCPVVCYEDDRLMADVERSIMDWAAEHPEQRYPTWNEWHESNFPGVSSPICPEYFSNNICESHETCTQCRAQPIPADIAQKLGIKPITEME